MDSSEKRSPVWEFFKLVTEGDKKKVECQLCKSMLVYCGGTTTMKSHLQHPGTQLSAVSNKTSGTSGGVDAMVGAMKQSSLQTFVASGVPKMNKLRYERLTTKLAHFCAQDFRPISIVNGEGFQNFLKEMDPSYQVPSHTTIRNYIRKSYLSAKESMIEHLSKQKGIAITTDLWTSVATEGYITVTTHYVNEAWQLQSQVIGTRVVDKRHTGQNIAEEINQLTTKFQISNLLIAAVHDNASNMDVAMRELAIDHFPCAGHTLQLAIGDALKAADISKVVARCRHLVAFFNRSIISSALEVRQKAGNSNQKPLGLLQNVSTRWNSTFIMLQRLLL